MRVLHTFWGLPTIVILLCAAFPLRKISQLLHWIIPSSNLYHLRSDLTLDVPFYLLFQVALDVFRI